LIKADLKRLDPLQAKHGELKSQQNYVGDE
jgi:hypothetical protein